MRPLTLAKRIVVVGLALAVLLVGCAPAQSPGGGSAQPQQVAGPKRITAAMMGNPRGAIDNFIGGGSGGGVPGAGQLEQLLGGALTTPKDRGAQLVAQLAEAVPTFENGLWRVLPDGRMETTWKIRPGARWHDGTPFTSADMLFTTRLEQDRELPVQRSPAYDLVTSIEAPDPQTVTVAWKSPFIEADEFFRRAPIPRHILERPYLESKESFTALPYWNAEFIGAGPYRVRDWVRDSHAVLLAFDEFVLGRPRIDEITLKFLADETAFMANILAGVIDVSIGKSINHEQTMEIKAQWRSGRIESRAETVIKIWPQFVDPNPAVILDVRFRKALVHAINRQELVDSLVGAGESSPAHSILFPGEPYFPDGEATAVRYDYDPRRATEMIEQLGYGKGPDGAFRDSRGERLWVEINATDEAQNTKPMFAVTDYWKRVGLAAESLVIPIQLQDDRRYRATFSGFNLQGSGSGVRRLKELTGPQARLPENNFTGRNYPRYINPEFDALIERVVTTIPRQERVQALQQAVQHMTDQIVMVPLYYAPMSSMISNRVANAGFDPTWNAHEWDVK